MKRLWIMLLFFGVLVLPNLARAENTPAGFPQSPLWLSKTELTTGDGVTIYTVVYNSSQNSLQGTVVFQVDGKPVGSKPWSAAPGTTEIISQTWAATEGEHAITAKIEGLSGSTLPLSALVTSTTTVTVAPLPAPPEIVTDTQVAVDTIAGTLGDTAPILGDVASSTSNIAEDVREGIVGILTDLASTTAPKGQVLGASDEIHTEPTAKKNMLDSVWDGTQKAFHGVIVFLLAVASSPLWFYLAILVLLIVLIWFFKMVRRERSFSRR